MNRDHVEGNWKQLKGKIQEEWVKLTDSDLDVIDGKRERLTGKIQEYYGHAKEEIEKKLDEWVGKLKKE